MGGATAGVELDGVAVAARQPLIGLRRLAITPAPLPGLQAGEPRLHGGCGADGRVPGAASSGGGAATVRQSQNSLQPQQLPRRRDGADRNRLKDDVARSDA